MMVSYPSFANAHVQCTEQKSNSIPCPIRIGPEPSTRIFFLSFVSIASFSVCHRRIQNSNMVSLPQTLLHRYQPSCMLHGCRTLYAGLDLSFCLSCQVCDDVVRELQTFCFQKKVFVQLLSFQSLLHLNKDSQLIDEPDVDLCDIMKLLLGNISSQASAIFQIRRSSTMFSSSISSSSERCEKS